MTGALRAFVLLLCCAALTACDGRTPIAAADLAIELRADKRTVACGQGFALDVVRTWSKSLTPERWDDRILAPLVVRALGVDIREDGARVEETRRFVAYAFRRDDARLPPTRFVARTADGVERSAESVALEISIQTEVDADAPGVPELPPGPLSGTGGGWTWLLGGLATLILLWIVARLARPVASTAVRAPAPPPTEPTPDHRAFALRALATLRDQDAADEAARIALHEQAALTVRSYLADAHSVGTPEWTSEEVLAGAGVLSASALGSLRTLLTRCDGVKFAGRSTTVSDCVNLLDCAEQCIDQAARS